MAQLTSSRRNLSIKYSSGECRAATLVDESLTDYRSFFPGTKPVLARDVVAGYVKSAEGAQTYIAWACPATDTSVERNGRQGRDRRRRRLAWWSGCRARPSSQGLVR